MALRPITMATGMKLLEKGGTWLRAMPANLRSSEEAHFQGLVTCSTPDMGVSEYDQAVIAVGGEPFHGGELLPQYFSEEHRFLARDRERFAKRRARAEMDALPLAGEHVFVTDRFSANYYHWLCDTLPRLEAISRTMPLASLLLPPSVAALPFVVESLQAWPQIRIAVFPQADRAVRVERLIIPDHAARNGDHAPDLLRRVRQRLIAHFAPDSRPLGRRVHVSRAGARIRRIANETQLEPVLARHGFETLHFEQMSLGEQIRAMVQSSAMVAIHGAGLANMLFMEPASSVLEIRQLQGVPDCFHSLANACGHSYRYQLAEPERAGIHPHAADLIVDPDQLDAEMREMTA